MQVSLKGRAKAGTFAASVIVLSVFSLSLLSGCGKKAPPRPPEELASSSTVGPAHGDARTPGRQRRIS